MRAFGSRTAGLAAAVVITCACVAAPPVSPVDGDRAFAHVRHLVELGPRVVGSEAHRKAEQYVEDTLGSFGVSVERQEFTAATPLGPRSMVNLIAEIPGASDEIIVLAGHYDTKIGEGFVGANDGGSSTGLLLELGRILAQRKNGFTVRLVFFDGEEAFQDWSETDSLYGSRHLAAAWASDGTLSRIAAFILLDMIGDSDLNLQKDYNSTPWLRNLVWDTAASLGYGEHFTSLVTALDDDHVPFGRAGVPVVDLIDFDYGPGHRYWHTRYDTLDKISARSLQIVGEVALETLKRLEQRRPAP